MDHTDINIINILLEDGRGTLKEIGQQVGLTPPAVKERITRLETDQVIEGYTVKINLAKLNRLVSAFVFVDVTPEKYDSFCRFCEQEEEIVEHHHIIGVHNSMLRVAVHNSQQLENLLSKIKHYGTSQTDILLSTYFTAKPIDL